MRRIRIIFAVLLIAFLVVFLCACFAETEDQDSTSAPELTLGELPDYLDAHAEDAPYIVFSSDLEPISAERIEKVRTEFYQLLYKNEYNVQTELLKETGLDENDIFQKAHSLAVQYAESYKSTLMNPDNTLYNDAYTYVCRYASRYYGTVSGCEIISFHSFVPVQSSIELGGVKIENPTRFYIFAVKDDEIVALDEAYGKEWLKPIDIILIAKRNSDFNSYWEENYFDPKVEYKYIKYVDDLEELSDEMIDEIKVQMFKDTYESSYSQMVNSYTEKYGGLYSREKIEDIAALWATRGEQAKHDSFMRNANADWNGWRYYGIIGGYAVFADVDVTDNVKVYHLGSYKIRFGNGTEMFVYSSDTGMVELKEAYDRGLLTDTDIAKISERHEAYHDYLTNK